MQDLTPRRSSRLTRADLDSLSKIEKYVLAMVDGQKTAKQIISSSRLGAKPTAEVLAKLIERGLAELPRGKAEPPPPQEAKTVAPLNPFEMAEEVELSEEQKAEILRVYTKLPQCNYYDILNVPVDASAQEIQRAFMKQSQLFHPDRYFGMELGSFQEKMEEIFNKLVQAYQVVSNEDLRNAYDKEVFYSLSSADKVKLAARAKKGIKGPERPAEAPPQPKTPSRMAGSEDLKRRDVVDILLAMGQVTQDQVDQARRDAQQLGGTVESALLDNAMVDESVYARVLAKKLELPLVELTGSLSEDALAALPLEAMQENTVIPVDMDRTSKTLRVAMVNPRDMAIIDKLQFMTGFRIAPCVATRTAIVQAIHSRFFGGTYTEIDLASNDQNMEIDLDFGAKGQPLVENRWDVIDFNRLDSGSKEDTPGLNDIAFDKASFLALVNILMEKGFFTKAEFLTSLKRK